MNEFEIENLAAKAIESEDFIEARRLLEPLVALNSEYALVTLGWMHENAKGMPYNLKLAESLYERATRIGCLEAFNCLGLVLRKEKEFARARNVYRTGAELGNLGSMCWLGAMMIWGEGGPVDIEHGTPWLIKAAENGHFRAKVFLVILEKENSKSIFRHVIFHFKRMVLGLRAGKEYYSDPYSGKIF